MLVLMDCFDEESKLKKVRDTLYYQDSQFGKAYYQRISEMNAIVEAAKVYVMDNYRKITDWTELTMEIRQNAETFNFGMKNEERARRYPSPPRDESKPIKRRVRRVKRPGMDEMFKKIDEERIQVETFEPFYDWTDGDFTVKVNGVQYLWIDHRNPDAVIAIANFIETHKLAET